MNANRFAVAMLVAGATLLLPGCATYDDFKLTTANGEKMSLSEQNGKAVLVTFWAHG